ncbi:uncharacterized protein LOC133532812, partial [Cydia pomonella]|uniref:uncharacterized protein LOC133532812 n=1 Tax=Cydia pomonella TaxID=82600 RepID=UPI002ADD3E9F
MITTVKLKTKSLGNILKNDTLEIHHSEAENDSELENDSKLKNDRKLEDKVIRIYIKNDTLKNENIEAEKESELENDSNLKNERKLEKKVMRKYIKNDTFEIENSETPIDVKNMIKKIEKQMADVREKVHEGFENDREFDNKVMRKYNKNDTLRIDNSEATIYLKSKINKIQKQIEDVRGHVNKGFENNREFENDHKFENQVIRKYIKNDTFNIDNSEAPIDVKYMIKNIEKQIDEMATASASPAPIPTVEHGGGVRGGGVVTGGGGGVVTGGGGGDIGGVIRDILGSIR